MKNTPLAPRRGFTLVELSIVLVIIGLLVAGLMGTTSLIRNAKLSTMMNEGKYYQNAFIQFQTRYNAPPGDFCSIAAGGTCGTPLTPNSPNLVWPGAAGVDAALNGDGNGLIRAMAPAGGFTEFSNERYYAFRHLSLAGFIQGKFSGVPHTITGGANIATSDTTNPGNVPGTAIEGSAFIFDHPSETDGVVSGGAGGTDALYFDGMYSNVLRIAGLLPGDTDVPKRAFLTGKQALQVDEKFDDGKPGEGSVLTPVGGTTAANRLANCASSDVASTATYLTTSDDPTCYLIIRMQ